MGWVADVFSPERLRRLPGHRAIGHVRYSTAGLLESAQRAADHGDLRARPDRHRPQRQPDQRRRAAQGAGARRRDLPVELRHRGHPAPAGARAGRRRSRSRSPGRWPQVKGAYSRADPHARTRSIAVRDPYGLPAADARASWATPGSSRRETCALDLMEAELVRDVEPGELVVIDDARAAVASAPRRPASDCSACSSTSTSRGPTRCSGAATSTTVRKELGRQLAREHPRRGGHRHPGARLGRRRRARLLRGVGHPLRARPHPQPLRRAAPSSSPSRRSGTSA